jgi:hypothetical protein
VQLDFSGLTDTLATFDDKKRLKMLLRQKYGLDKQRETPIDKHE